MEMLVRKVEPMDDASEAGGGVGGRNVTVLENLAFVTLVFSRVWVGVPLFAVIVTVAKADAVLEKECVRRKVRVDVSTNDLVTERLSV